MRAFFNEYILYALCYYILYLKNYEQTYKLQTPLFENMFDYIPTKFISNLSDLWEIDAKLIIPIMFFTGYITLRILERKKLIKSKNTIDDIFLIGIFGFIWLSRFLFLVWLPIHAFEHIKEDIATIGIITLFCSVTIISIVMDILYIGKHISEEHFNFKMPRKRIFSNKKIFRSWQEIKRDLPFEWLILAIFLSIMFFLPILEKDMEIFVYGGFIGISSFLPSLLIVAILYKHFLQIEN